MCLRAVKRCTVKRHAAFMFVHGIPFALLRVPAGSFIPCRVRIHVMLEFADIKQRAPSAKNAMNSQPAAIALSGTSLTVRTMRCTEETEDRPMVPGY